MAHNTVTAPVATAAGLDPLGELRFRVEVPGVEIGRFAQCSGLGCEYEVLEYAEGGNNQVVHRLRGRAWYPNLVLGRGLTHEDALLHWFFTYQKGAQRPTVTVTLFGDDGSERRRFAFAAGFPIKWTGPQTGAASSDAMTESLEIGHMGLVV